MVKKLWNIIKGTYFNIFNKKLELADKRLKICELCEYREQFHLGDICGQCGCILESKTRVEDEHCVLKKW